MKKGTKQRMEAHSEERAKKEGRESENGIESKRWSERGRPGGGAEHHVIVP